MTHHADGFLSLKAADLPAALARPTNQYNSRFEFVHRFADTPDTAGGALK